MCGICGFVDSGGVGPGAEALLKRMTDAIVHRGPDDEGFFVDGQAALGMRRLSIIDLATGHQPIHNEDRTVWIVFNGEIYNFPEIKKDLEGRGHSFYTNADTEVVVHLYEERGPDFVEALNGMFAVALWDAKRRRLILARDRMGVKPLHYRLDGGRLTFASEIKALLQAPGAREIDLDSLSRFFTFEYIPAPRSIFKGIRKLLPGHRLVFEDGRAAETCYWDVRHAEHKIRPRPEEDYCREIIDRLRESVRRRLISDVPLGVFLSGGIDSSAITALMSEVAGAGIKTYSIGFREKSFDELDAARIVAAKFGTDHTEFVVTPAEVSGLVPTLAGFLDEPLADASVIPTYVISKLARPHVTVALVGDGGDEQFGGYDTYKAYKMARWYRKVPGFVRRGLVRPVVRALPASAKRLSFEFKAKKFISGVEYPPETANIIWWGAYPPEMRERLFSSDVLARMTEDPFAPVAYHSARTQAADPLDRIAYLDLKLYLQDDLLPKADRMSMAASLELRSPFLDYTFVEYAATIPSSLKLKGFASKYILKKALAGRLPDSILKKKKIGFDIPLGAWMRGDLRDFVRDTLAPERLRRHGYFNEAFVSGILKEHFDGSHNHRQLLWPLIIFQNWHDRYAKPPAE
ncbi:MAG: asparagine synthase (glutamine-hydrolyzing) [Candidatus Aminicenantes bacterium]|nr:asparagine synthase (glutamine-hydrolyzing) [Candidatus Aminicenantes bacterium]